MNASQRQWLVLTGLIWMLTVPWFVAGLYSDMRRELDLALVNFAQTIAESRLLAHKPESSAECAEMAAMLVREHAQSNANIYILIRDIRCNPDVIYNSFPDTFSALPSRSGYADLRYQGQRFRVLVYHAGPLQIAKAVCQQRWSFISAMLKTVLLSFALIGLVLASILWLVRNIRKAKPSADTSAAQAEPDSHVDEDARLLSQLTGEFSFAGEPMPSVAELMLKFQAALQAEQIRLDYAPLSATLAAQTIAVPERVMLRSLLACARLLHAQHSLSVMVLATDRGIAWRMAGDARTPSVKQSGLVMDLAILEAATYRFVGHYHLPSGATEAFQSELMFPVFDDAILSAQQQPMSDA